MIQLENINVYYDKTQVLDNLTLHLKKNTILSVVGHSGSGKSTLLKAILGIVPSEGTMLFQGKAFTEGILGKHIGVVFQDTLKHLIPHTTIQKQLISFVQTHEAINKEDIIQEACTLLEMMDIKNPEKLLQRYPHQLSGGQIQRIGILFAMILKPEVLLLDEMTSALDVVAQRQLLHYIVTLKKTYKTSILLITHHLGVVDAISDEIAVLDHGHIVEYGNKDTLLKDPQSKVLQELLEARMKVKAC